MISFSAEAEEELKRRVKEVEGALGIRIQANGTNANPTVELSIEMPLTKKQKRKGMEEPKHDKLLRIGNVIVFVDPKSSIYIENHRLNYMRTLGDTEGQFTLSSIKDE